jgi:hypothetical protein
LAWIFLLASGTIEATRFLEYGWLDNPSNQFLLIAEVDNQLHVVVVVAILSPFSNIKAMMEFGNRFY